MEVRQIMTGQVITVGQAEPVAAAVRLLRRYNLGALPVCDDAGRLRGMITDRDILLRCVARENDVGSTKVSEVMSRGIVTAAPGDSVSRAAEIMARDRVRRLPVTEGNKVVGMVSVCDMARRPECRAEYTAAMEGIVSNLSIR